MRNKSVWIINQYLSTPELSGDTHRHYNIARYLKKEGYNVTLITSSFSHVPRRHNKQKGIFKVAQLADDTAFCIDWGNGCK